MSQAPTYARSTSFADDERNNAGGRATVRTAALDAEFDAIAESVDQTIGNLSLIQRDDGVLRDGVVPTSALSADVLKLIASFGGVIRGAWVTLAAYGVKDVVTQSGNTYVAAVAHTAGVFATDLAAGRWVLVQLGAAPNASGVPFTPTATVLSTNAQDAVAEVDTKWRSFATGLASTADATKAAGQVGFNYALVYPVGSTGRWLQDLAVGDGSLFGYQAPTVRAVRRMMRSRLADAYSVHDFGLGRSSGAMDASLAIQKAQLDGVPITLDAGAVYMSTKIAPAAGTRLDLTSVGPGATLQLEGGTHDYLIDLETGVTITLRNIHVDGNRAGNNVGSLEPAAILNRLGSFYMYGGSVKNALHDAIRSGNVEDGTFDQSQFAQVTWLEGVQVNGGLSTDRSLDGVAPQDCFRIFRTKLVRLINCGSIGGLSAARLGFFNDDVEVRGGTYRDSFGDVGVTIYFTKKWVVDGVKSSGHVKHGFEIDACNNGVLSNWVALDNGMNGVLLTEYGPPEATASHAGTYDDVTTVYGTLYPCRGVLIGQGVARRNGMAGIKTIGQGSGVTIRGPVLEDNGKSGTSDENCGLFISGGTLNDDGITFGGITFVNSGNQQWSARKSNSQFKTFSEGNTHIGGRHFDFAIDGWRTRFTREAVDDTSRWTGASTLVPDSLSPTGYARKVTDSSSSGSTVVSCTIPCPPSGEKIIPIQLRTLDTLTSVTVDVTAYDGATAKTPSLYNAAQTLTTAYKAVQIEVPDSASSRNYDRLVVTFTTDSALTGNLLIALLDPYGSMER